ncbi:hypothetical protein H5410_023244 [Solanum commersonii]|uniref:Uncharacterized protein n=1 Tax=Solanum commersonii TaxID=4109 RepID=A0A9J5ZGA8_SOLCO|nr:hypothetical protein H5410_023244 [Solanum commersonii]
MIVHGKRQKMNYGILSKKRGNEGRDLDNWKHIIDVNIYLEAIFQSEVEILENIGAEVGRGSISNPFVPLVEHCLNFWFTMIILITIGC